MLMSVALLVCQLSVEDCPGLIVSGLAVNDAVGAAGGGGGGGGAGGCFLWQAPRNSIAPNAKMRAIDLKVSCFKFFLPNNDCVASRRAKCFFRSGRFSSLPDISRTRFQVQ